jgi:gastrin-releasing peptide receptor
MIHHTIIFVAITTLHLAFVTFTMDIYSTDASIWSQTETTTDWQNHSSGTAYQQMETTEIPVSFTNMSSTVHNKLNVILENLVFAFNTASYVGKCSDLLYHLLAYKFIYIPYDCEFPQELIRTAWELHGKFDTLTKTALWFICTGNTTVGLDINTLSRIYVHNFTEFVVRVNGSKAAIGEVAVLDTVAVLYRTSIQQVESMMEVVEHLANMILEEVKLYTMKVIILKQLQGIDFFNKISVLEFSVGKQKELVILLQNISERAGNMSKHTDGNRFINVITSGNVWRFVDAQYWAKLNEEETKLLVNYQTMLHEVQNWEFIMYKLAPVIVAIVLVVGIMGNGLLLTIFVRHKETRTLANSMLINLTFVDLLSMVVNVLLEYLRVITRWQFGWLDCKLFFFSNYLLLTVSTYSVAMISVQRFVAVRQLRSFAWCHQSQKTKYVLIATVWCLGCILSVPHGVAAFTENGNCNAFSLGQGGPMYTADLIMFCVVPLLITAAFSGLTAYRIQRSVREIPGEATGQGQLQHSRMVSSTVLLALTVLFVVSNVPFFLFQFLIVVVQISMTTWKLALFNVVTYCLKYVNCCLNPIVVLVMSKRYRGYIKKYCGYTKVLCREGGTARNKSGSSIETSL